MTAGYAVSIVTFLSVTKKDQTDPRRLRAELDEAPAWIQSTSAYHRRP